MTAGHTMYSSDFPEDKNEMTSAVALIDDIKKADTFGINCFTVGQSTAALDSMAAKREAVCDRESAVPEGSDGDRPNKAFIRTTPKGGQQPLDAATF